MTTYLVKARSYKTGLTPSAIGGATYEVTADLPDPPPAGGSYTVPLAIDSTGATDVTLDLHDFLFAVPNGSDVHFQTGGEYNCEWPLQIYAKNNVHFYGHGATIKANLTGFSDPVTFPATTNGVVREWDVGQALGFGEIPTVTVNGAPQVVKSKSVAGAHGAAFYWTSEDPILEQDTLTAVLTAGDTLVITYRYFTIPTVPTSLNPALRAYPWPRNRIHVHLLYLTDCTFHDLHVKGNRTVNTGPFISDLEAQCGYQLNACVRTSFYGCDVYGIWGDAFYLSEDQDGSNYYWTVDTLIDDPNIQMIGRQGFTARGCARTEISNFYFGDIKRSWLDIEPPGYYPSEGCLGLNVHDGVLGWFNNAFIANAGASHAIDDIVIENVVTPKMSVVAVPGGVREGGVITHRSLKGSLSMINVEGTGVGVEGGGPDTHLRIGGYRSIHLENVSQAVSASEYLIQVNELLVPANITIVEPVTGWPGMVARDNPTDYINPVDKPTTIDTLPTVEPYIAPYPLPVEL